MNDVQFPKNPDFAKPLIEMEPLLRRIGRDYYANYVSEVVKLLETDPMEAKRRLTSNDFWGGAGSFIDMEFCLFNGDVSDDYQRDNCLYRRLLLQVLRNLRDEVPELRQGRVMEKIIQSYLDEYCSGR